MKFCETYYLDDPMRRERVFDIFMPEKVTRDVALFFVHGGGWHAGHRDIFHEIMEGYNREGFICATAGYRLNVDSFEQLADLREAYMAFAEILRERQRPLKIAVFGTSAGAHLAGLLLVAPPGAAGERKSVSNWIPPVAGMLQATPVTFEPWTDIFPPIAGEMQRAAGGVAYADDPERYRRLSMNSYLSKDNPPLFFLEAECEHIFPSAMTKDFMLRQRALGVPSEWKVYTMAEHGFIYALTRRQQKEAFQDMKDFLERVVR